jgi:hypothetical protein
LNPFAYASGIADSAAASSPFKGSPFGDLELQASVKLENNLGFNLGSKTGSGALEKALSVPAKDWGSAFAKVPEKLSVMGLDATSILRNHLFDPKNVFVTEARPYVFKEDLSGSMWNIISEQRNDIVKAYLSLFGGKAPKTAEDTALFNLILRKLQAGKTHSQIRKEIIGDYVQSLGRQVGKQAGLKGNELKVLEAHAVQKYAGLTSQSESLDLARAPEILKALLQKADSIKKGRV